MNPRAHLPIIASSETETCARTRTGLARAVLPEIGECLTTLVKSGITSAIDLRSLPMTDADRDELATLLGRGEVSMTISVAGDSEVWETDYPGIWWVRHRDGGGDIISEFIEIATVPEIAVAHGKDVERSHQRMARLIAESRHGGSDDAYYQADE